MFVYYSDVNAQTENYFFFLARIDQVWPTLFQLRYFASLDPLISLRRVEVDFRDRAKTAYFTFAGSTSIVSCHSAFVTPQPPYNAPWKKS